MQVSIITRSVDLSKYGTVAILTLPHYMLPSMSESLSVANAPDALVNAAAKKAAKRKRFEDVFPLLKDELLQYLDSCKMPQDARDWYDRVSSWLAIGLSKHLKLNGATAFQNLEYNTPGGRRITTKRAFRQKR